MTWITKLKIEDSIKEIQKDEMSGKDFCLDPLRFEDLSLKDVRKELINEVKKRVESGYSMANLICIDVPKSNYILRPAARPNLIDWIIYNAVVNFIGSKIYKKIPKNSFSFNRFRDRQEKKKKISSIDYWIRFEDESVSLSKDFKYSYLLTTDITSFLKILVLKP